jgi:hypothetical protein
MEYGSIFGHGAYLGPDYTADYLRRAALLSTVAPVHHAQAVEAVILAAPLTLAVLLGMCLLPAVRADPLRHRRRAHGGGERLGPRTLARAGRRPGRWAGRRRPLADGLDGALRLTSSAWPLTTVHVSRAGGVAMSRCRRDAP